MCTGLEFLAAGSAGAATAGTAAVTAGTAAAATAATAGTAAAASTGLAATLGGWGNIAMMGGTLLSGLSQFGTQSAAARQAGAQAGYAQASGEAQAQNIRGQVRQEVGSARAAIAGNNTALDEFSLINTRNIEYRGERDAQMSILSANREANTLMQQASQQSRAAGSTAISSLLSAGGQAYTGWKGAQKATLSTTSDPYSSFYLNSNRSVGD